MVKLNPLLIFAAIVIGFAVILMIVGLAAPGWGKYESPVVSPFGSPATITYEIGLFKLCVVDGSCSSTLIPIDSDILKAVKALLIIGLLAAIASLVFTCLYLLLILMDKLSEMFAYLPLVSLIASVVGGGFTIVGSIVFAADNYDVYDPYYSFFLAIIGGIAVIVGGGLTLASKQTSQVG